MGTMEETAPRIFISYSHDTPEHKRWVGELASRLVKNGIDIVLDQWELGLGDDVPKFMENSLRESERVLVICTENYVRKANDGKGGVGYESMIVTGELIRNLGTKKFIPVIRQSSSETVLPISLSTRFYLNLSEDANFEEQFNDLLSELHKKPKETKPPLGKNPFAVTPSGNEVEVEPIFDVAKRFSDKDSVEVTYEKAISIAKAGDFVEWRKLIRQAKSDCSSRLIAWRKRINNKTPDTPEQALVQTLEGIDNFDKLICIALAGVESGRENFKSQASLLDDILYPNDWPREGLTYYIRVPESVVFVYQALHGALCLQTHQLNLAVALARTKIKPFNSNESESLFRSRKLIGWPHSMGGNAKKAWEALEGLYERWSWLSLLFGDRNDYVSALLSYYMALNTNELVAFLAEKKVNTVIGDGPESIDTPLFAFFNEDQIQAKAYHLLVQDVSQVKRIWESLNVPYQLVETHWDAWIKKSIQWVASIDHFSFYGNIGHRNLIKDLKEIGM